jgi:hypothetical protein
MQQQGGGPTLRPLGAGEILDVAIKVYTRNLGTFLGITAVIYAPIALITLLGLLSLLPEGAFVRNSQLYWSFGADDTAFYVFTGIIAVVGYLFTLLATAAGTRAVADAYLGTKPSFGRSYAAVGRRFHSLLWLTLLYGLVLAVGFLLLIIPGIYLSIALIVAVPALVVEDVRGSKALRRSRDLVSGRWWATLGVVLLGVFLVPFVIQFAIGFILGIGLAAMDTNSPTTLLTVNQVANFLAQVAAVPIQIAVITILYFDLRVRKEAFDLQLLTERIGALPGGTASGTPSSLSPPPTSAPGTPPPPGG